MLNKLLYIRDEIFSIFFYVIDFIYPKQNNLMLIGAGAGKSYFNNSRYLYEYIKANEPSLEIIWLTKNPEVYQYLSQKYGAESVVLRQGISLYHLLFRAKLIFLSHGSKDMLFRMFNPSPRKVVIQLWHGISNKKTGFCIANAPRTYMKIEYAKYDYLVSNSYVDMIVNNKNFRKPVEKVLVTGLPKNDGLEVSKKTNNLKHVLYAPTYGATDLFPFTVDLLKFDKYLKSIDMELIVSAHRNDFEAGLKDINDKSLSNIKFTNQNGIFDIQEYTNKADVLITDYSSMFWDFLAADKPTVFVCSAAGPEQYDSFTLLDYRFITGDHLVQDYESLINLLKSLKEGSYCGALKVRRDIIVDLFFDKEENRLTGSEAIMKKAKSLLNL